MNVHQKGNLDSISTASNRISGGRDDDKEITYRISLHSIVYYYYTMQS